MAAGHFYLLILDIYIGFLILLLVFFSLFKAYRIAKPRRSTLPSANTDKREYEPRVLVIVPCKGIDITANDNLMSIRKQRYGNFAAVAVVDSKRDPAMDAINDVHMDYILSSRTYPTASGKVNAISTAIKKFRKFDVYVVADSDIFVGRDWLEKLIAPLADLNTGIATTFPYFEPVGGFWPQVKTVWGLVGQGMMESKITRFSWGGSMAFRKDIFDSEPYFKKFCEAVSDDIALTKIAKEKELDIAYVPEAAPVVRSNDNFGVFWEWSNRQTALSISGNRKLFPIGIAFYGFQMLLFASGIALSAVESPIFAVFLIPTALSIVQDAAKVRCVRPSIIIASVFMPFIYFANLLVGRAIRRIRWRGLYYTLH
jgi:cellulose synthase/poly-beta-1,6-N-acetylglucosamine synthase-like glycosyltransferase